jgi:hypothetical protein
LLVAGGALAIAFFGFAALVKGMQARTGLTPS